MPGRFLNFFKPVARVMPEVKAPLRRVKFTEKLIWSAIALVFYFILSEIPLYGISTQEQDPFLFSRVIFASSRGTLMELGIQPIVTASLILQVLAGSGLVGINMQDPEDRSLFTSLTKFFSILMTVGLALAYTLTGTYGQLSTSASAIIFVELALTGVILMLLDELLQKGWGIGSGISLFIVASVTQRILWSALSPLPLSEGRSIGAIFAYAQTLLDGNNPWSSFLFREDPNAPTMLGFVSTIVIVLVIIYLQGLRVEIPATYAKFKGFRQSFPIKLLYLSTVPIILTQSLLMNIYFFGQQIALSFNPDGSNFLLNLFCQFDAETAQPNGGLVYYVLPSRSLSAVLDDPIKALVYAAILIAATVIFSRIWIDIGGMGSSSVASQFLDSGLHIPGHRRSHRAIQRVLERYIPIVTILGSIVIGVIAVLADFLSVFGTAMGILITVDVMQNYYQTLMEEKLIEEHPLLAKIVS